MRILTVGDIHAPFTHTGYLDFCKGLRAKYKTTHTIFIGDVIDAHYSSFHDSDPDGMSAREELFHARRKLQEWHKAFPNAEVTIGNHDRIASRKVFAAGLSQMWLRDLNDVLGVPSWTFHNRIKRDGILYIHGEGVTARTKAARIGCSVVQGHRHTESYVWHLPGEERAIFGLQVGCGIDAEAYAFAYAKDAPPPALSAAVILDGVPQIIPMNTPPHVSSRPYKNRAHRDDAKTKRRGTRRAKTVLSKAR
jgi:hypothetical protein